MNLFLEYIKWHFVDLPREIKRGWINYLKFFAYFFSIPLLLKTFFSPWRRYRWSYGRGFEIGRFVETFLSNLFMRILGAFLRFWVIIFGLIIESLVFVGGMLFLCIWISMPAWLIYLFILGIKLAFS